MRSKSTAASLQLDDIVGREKLLRIVIDFQGAQTSSRNRGIGRYSLALVKEIVRQRGDDEVLIALNGLITDSIEPLRAELDGLLPRNNILVWDAPGPVNWHGDGNADRLLLAECVREAFLASLAPDIVLVTSLFEGMSDDAVGTIGKHFKLPTAVILYDLIPYMHSAIYLGAPEPRTWYYDKIDNLKRADILLAISSSSAREAVQNIDFPKRSIANVSTASDGSFYPRPVTDEARVELARRFGIDRPYILYVSATDDRKNHIRLLTAYASLPQALRSEHQLVLAGRLPDDHRARFTDHAASVGLGPDEFIITGSVTDDELLTIYNGCKAFVFPSWHEGFGLPALEAMHCGRAVIASDVSSLPEVVGCPDALFDPYDVESIAEKMTQVLTDETFRRRLEEHGAVQSARFTWKDSAARALEFMRGFVAKRHRVSRNASAAVAAPWALKTLLAKLEEGQVPVTGDRGTLAGMIAADFPPPDRPRQLLVDVSELHQRDAGTGIQRVVRSILLEWLSMCPVGWVVKPVYATRDELGYRYAQSIGERLFGLREVSSNDVPVEALRGDVFVALDLQQYVIAKQIEVLADWRRRGVEITYFVHDLLPVTLPQFFPGWAPAIHETWLHAVAQADQAVCNSRTTANELRDWLDRNSSPAGRPLRIDWSHLGADLENAPGTTGLPADADEVLAKVASTVSVLMVGTIEPRKGHRQSLKAFERLWAQGAKINLVIVGATGWDMDEFTARLRNHPEAGKRLMRLDQVSDEYLDAIYQAGTCLLAASEGEGFGIPLIEAARHGLPIIARDLPIFREVAGEHAFYFPDDRAANTIASCVEEWMKLFERGAHPTSDGFKWLTWKQSSARLLQLILERPVDEGEWRMQEGCDQTRSPVHITK